MCNQRQRTILYYPIFCSLLFIVQLFAQDAQQKNVPDNILWYKQPATEWVEALPIGNGRLGGMVFGKTDYERVQLNEESLWTGSATVTDKSNAYKYLPEVRRLLFEGKYAEAQKITERDMMAEETWNMYQSLGDLYFKINHTGEISDYTRECNLQARIFFKPNRSNNRHPVHEHQTKCIIHIGKTCAQ
jgi:alpha-L-fucosidase 2